MEEEEENKVEGVMRRKTIPLLIRVSVHVRFGKYVRHKIEFLSHDLRAIRAITR